MRKPDFYYSIKYGVRNLIRWLPVIWNDRDWDEHFLYILMAKKLEHMEELHIKYGFAENSTETAAQIRETRQALERLNEHKYFDKAMWCYGIKDTEMLLKNTKVVSKIVILESELMQKDLKEVFSDKVAERIENWWD